MLKGWILKVCSKFIYNIKIVILVFIFIMEFKN